MTALVALTGVRAEAAEWGDWRPYPGRPGLYRERCARCHGDAGTFAPARLEIVDGVVRSRSSGRALAQVLRDHPGRPDVETVAALAVVLAEIVEGGGQFERRCAICHGSARSLAQRQLVLDDAGLHGRWSGRDIERYLADHARLDAAGAAFFTEVLGRFAPRRAAGK